MLRELILELAVRGKLVPQDPNDEPASVLLERVAQEKKLLTKERKIKKQKKFPEIEDDEKPYSLPSGWFWQRLANVGHDWGQKKPDDEFTYIDVSAIDNLSGSINSPNVLTASDAPSRARKKVQTGTVIYSTVRPYLQNICVIDREYSPEPIVSTAFAILHPYQQMPGKFFIIFLRSPVFIKYVESVQTGIAYPAINDKQFFGAIIPIPPIAEQHRIVAKVDELMALCDKLEQHQTDSNATHQTLVETLLTALTNAADQAAFADTWRRIADHFDTLFTTEQSIDHLKQTILQLAIMGKLVPQNPDDEPASVLLERIAEEKARLIKEGKIKKQKKMAGAADSQQQFELPLGWQWCNLTDVLALVTDGDHQAPPKSDDGVPFLVIGNLNTGKIIFQDSKFVLEGYYDGLDWGKKPSQGDILYTVTGSYGIPVPVLTTKHFCVQRHVAILKSTDSSPNEYLPILLGSKYVFDYATKIATGIAQKTVPLTGLRKMPIPVPPLAEQHRIVAKVDELMALCETLKAGLSEAQTIQVNLADAIVQQATAPVN